jgi:hypothetical protein
VSGSYRTSLQIDSTGVKQYKFFGDDQEREMNYTRSPDKNDSKIAELLFCGKDYSRHENGDILIADARCKLRGGDFFVGKIVNNSPTEGVLST